VQYQLWLGAVAGLTMILGAVYMLKAFQKAMSGEVSYLVTGFTDLTMNEKMVLYPMVVLIIVMGVYPAPLLALSEPAVNDLLKIISDVTAQIK
jgi:NADH-quinone oxidoreductase subunit M